MLPALLTPRVLGDKSLDSQFIKVISEYDIIGLSELHTDKLLSIPGFVRLSKEMHPKNRNSSKMSGGIAVLIRQHLADNFQVIPNDNIDSIWIKTIDKYLGGQGIYFGFFYCSPSNPLSNFFNVLRRKLICLIISVTLIFGDFNA